MTCACRAHALPTTSSGTGQVAWTRAYLHGASASARLRTLRTSPARSGSWVARSAQSGVQDSTATTDREAAWREAVQLMRSGEVRQYKAIRCNRGGVIVQVGPLEGFIPYNLLDPTRLPADMSKADLLESCLAGVIGSEISAQVVRVDVPSKDLLLSERGAVMAQAVDAFRVGEVVEGVVTSLADFGAFCALQGPDGEFHGAEGLIHLSELSWQRISAPDAVVKKGDRVRVKVVGVDKRRRRITLSLKQLSEDPIKETLEDLLPLGDSQESAAGSKAFSGSSIAGVSLLCQTLLAEPGVASVQLGRRGRNDRVVSQDLEIWLTTQEVSDGFNVVARAGTDVQEIHVVTSMSRNEMKQAIQTALNKLP